MMIIIGLRINYAYFTEGEVAYSWKEEVSYLGEEPFVHRGAFPLVEVAYACLEEPSYLGEVGL